MRDERFEKLARLLVDYSIEAGKGDQVLLSGGVAAEPAIKAIYARLLDVGAIPVPQVGLPGMQELFFEHAQDSHYEKTPPITRSIFEQADAFISIMAPTNTRALANVDPAKQQALGKRDKDVQEIVMGKDRWALTLFPTEALAQESDMGLQNYEEFVFEAMALNEDDPVTYWQGNSKGTGPAHRAPGTGQRSSYHGSRDGSDAIHRRTQVHKRRRQEEYALRGGLYRSRRRLS